MDLQEAAGVAKQHVGDMFAAEGPSNLRLESFLYDDHLAVWTLTIGFTLAGAPSGDRSYKVVKVSEVNKSVLSVGDP